MSRPLVVTDCDEVLLHMVRHFADWLGREHDIDFALEGNPFAQSMTRRGSDEALDEKEVWALLGSFFDTEMSTQTPIAGAVNAIAELQRDADVVVLTNLADHRYESRRAQLLDLGITAKVYTNQGPKGRALDAIVQEYSPSSALFIDDLAVHHASAAKHSPAIHRLHFCGEPAIAPHIPCALEAGNAHARIDTWDDALHWIQNTLYGENSNGR
ncbi:HAD family hydrolase [Aurantiacibacter sp. D1-12]|uniref:HAD family hydrolase n=1 Tax=Aurantiacibacter sp. D1-12 TaxID=2993658 RepID=UPI00237CC432|nr:HAD family hydrolase [Aurantiacibacter sp. D1-12]MDE1468564.1 HAD family hydrolase [Aurantiacibacter sp. D1-12]